MYHNHNFESDYLTEPFMSLNRINYSLKTVHIELELSSLVKSILINSSLV